MVQLNIKFCENISNIIFDYVNNDQHFRLFQAMKSLGAIPFCLTNVPQTMNTYACSNPVFGLTTHPLDKERTPGGSSGGEGCLIAMGGSILGLGSDVGGSLRIPAHFCGISALKPTTGRLFERGRRKGAKGQIIGVKSNAGFMARRVEGVIIGKFDIQYQTDSVTFCFKNRRFMRILPYYLD